MAKKKCDVCGDNIASDYLFGVALCTRCKDAYYDDQKINAFINDAHIMETATPEAKKLFIAKAKRTSVKPTSATVKANITLQERKTFWNRMRADIRKFSDEILSRLLGMTIGGKWLYILTLTAAMIFIIWCAFNKHIGIAIGVFAFSLLLTGAMFFLIKAENEFRIELKKRKLNDEELSDIDRRTKAWSRGVIIVTACICILSPTILTVAIQSEQHEKEYCIVCDKKASGSFGGHSYCTEHNKDAISDAINRAED